jgi:DhnA family fructose-bisphosphate aldolase class Ia
MNIERRLNRIFRPDGRALIVAMDHGLIDGPCKGLEQPAETIQKIVEGGADAVLTSYGLARRFAKQLAPLGLILRSDGAATKIGDKDNSTPIFFDVEEALRLGADALAVSGYPGSPREAASLENIATAVRNAHAWGVAVLAEMVPGGFDSAPEYRTVENIALGARLGVELGADFIKTPYCENFDQVTSVVYAPVVILGGAKRGKEHDMLAEIKRAVDSGAAGVAIGRNIFQADDPRRMTAAVAAILHAKASVDDAVKILEGRLQI